MQGLMCLSVGLCSGNMAAARLLVLFFHVYIYIHISSTHEQVHNGSHDLQLLTSSFERSVLK